MTQNLKVERMLWAVALVMGVCPLWATHELPLVDLPQHLHLISVLHRLDDASTLYPELFARRPELTPYLGYYYAVSLLNWLLPLELANKLFLSAYVVGLPLSLAFLLRSLKRPAWPALLAVPFAYGDSFAWGFINYISALPLTLLTAGLFVRAIADAPHRLRWAIGLALSLIAVLLFHVQAFAYLGVALPFLLLTTRAPEGRGWQARRHALAGVVPGVALFIAWVGLRLGQPAEIAPGQPWKSWGPLLSEQNLAWKTFDQNKAELVPTLAGMLPDGSDLNGVYGVALVAGLGLLLAVRARFDKAPESAAVVEEGPLERWRIVGLAALALLLYFALPFDIRGYMYYLNTRYAHLAAPLVLACVPPLPKGLHRTMLALAAAAAVFAGFTLARGFSHFDDEAKNLTALIESTAPKPRVMGLIWATQSRAMTHPLFLHASTVLARARGGVTNFSFALTPHSPLKYRGEVPPSFPSEWRPDQMNWETQGRWYDHFVVRGPNPRQIFGALLDSELYIAAQSGDFWLVRKR
ncbi:MAG: hypothetical protein IPJ65_07435 [Archangiaceae bacterium]|nr:hypothetical protein [Archangiaceae bacterium]